MTERKGHTRGNGGTSYTPLDIVESYLRRFIIYPSEHAIVAHVLWIAHTHMIDEWDTTPRIAFMSPLPESGKTRALEITELFVPNPKLSFSISAAAMVRHIAKGHEQGNIPTILFDEIDNVFSKADEGVSDLRAALNAGYRKNAMATRCINSGAGVADFHCYAALAMAGLKELPDALATRTIFVHMRRRANDEPKESFRLRDHPQEAVPIYDALAEWCMDHSATISTHRPELPIGIEDRTADVWEPLLAIADVAGGDWPKRARSAAVYLTGSAKDYNLSSDIELLAHIRDAFFEAPSIWTQTVVERLRDRPESPWNDIKGKPLDQRGLAMRLKPYRIKSRDVRISGMVQKGFLRSDFADAWKRYVDPVIPSATSATSATNLNNKNNFVADVVDVALRRGEEEESEPGSFEADGGLTREGAEPSELTIPEFLRRAAT